MQNERIAIKVSYLMKIFNFLLGCSVLTSNADFSTSNILTY